MLFEDFSFSIPPGAIIGVVGANGLRTCIVRVGKLYEPKCSDHFYWNQ